MTKKEVIEYFGSPAETARALHLTRAAICQWPDELSHSIAFKVELASEGVLLTDRTKRHLKLIGRGDASCTSI